MKMTKEQAGYTLSPNKHMVNLGLAGCKNCAHYHNRKCAIVLGEISPEMRAASFSKNNKGELND